MRRLVVLFPALNESANIGRVVGEALAVKLVDVELVPLVVDDGSKDDTGGIAERAGAKVVRHEKNRGVGAAFRSGNEWALANGADFLIHMDSDGQVLPREIPDVFGPVGRDDADLVLGSRFVAGAPPQNLERWKALALTSMARTIGALCGYSLSDISCGFRCMNRMVMEAVRPSFDYDYIQETLIQAMAIHARLVEVPVTVLYEKDPVRKGMSASTFRYSRRFMTLAAYSMANFYKKRAMELVGR